MSVATDRAATHAGERRQGFVDGVRVVVVALANARAAFTLGVVGAVVYATATVAASMVLGWATDEVVLPQLTARSLDAASLTVAVLAIVGVGVAKALGVVGRRLGAYVAQYRLQSTFRRRVTRRYQRLPLSWHRRHPTGELLANANSDVEAAFFLAAPLPMAVGAVLLLLITGGILVRTDPMLAAIGFGVAPLLAIANHLYQRRMRVAAASAQQSRAEVAQVAHESFDAALVIKTLGREAAEQRRFGAVADALRDDLVRMGRLRAFFDPVIEALPNIAILLVLLIGGWRVRDGELTPGDLVMFAYLFRLIAMPIRVFGWMLGEMPRAVAGHRRIRRVLEAHGDAQYGEATLDVTGPAALRVEDVVYLHPDVAADGPLGARAPHQPGDSPAQRGPAQDGTSGARGLRGVTFEVTPGGVTALVGATGSGKSTVAWLLARLVDPDRGRITIDGVDLRQLRHAEVAWHVAVVFQEAFLFDGTVRDNLTLGAAVDESEMVQAAKLVRADGFIDRLPQGYDTPVGERGTTLSGGERQRIALARAILCRPRLLVLDDATSAVDPSIEAEILEGLTGIQATVVIVASRGGSLALADRVVVLDDGVVIDQGAHEEVLARTSRYAAIVGAYDRDQPKRPAARDASHAPREPGAFGASEPSAVVGDAHDAAQRRGDGGRR